MKQLLALVLVVGALVGVRWLSANSSAGTALAAAPPAGPFYLCYDISPPDPAPQPILVILFDQFFGGGFPAEVHNTRLRLCSSATKNLSAGQAANPIVCYDLLEIPDDRVPVNRERIVKTQYGSQTLTFLHFVRLCVPAAKNANNLPQDPVYVCYSAQLLDRANIAVGVTGQFNAAAVDTVITSSVPHLCLRANKAIPGDRPLPHLACYPIDPVPPAPANPTVMVKTQFTMDGWTAQVGAASTLCMPVSKSFIAATPTPTPISTPPLGGFGVYPNLGGTSGGTGGVLAAFVAAGAAGVIVLGGGAWYARRRWRA